MVRFLSFKIVSFTENELFSTRAAFIPDRSRLLYREKLLIVVAALAACASASVPEGVIASLIGAQQRTGGVPPQGTFQYSYDTDTGISSSAQGKLKVVGKDEVALEVSGSNSYTSPEGQKVELTYIANENGYQPQGSHLPVPPEPLPIPEYIVRALKYIEAHPPPVQKPQN
ncbi:larval cuticle protein LCP-17-like [Colias croceus]|uniref:larval cuticle protein LCP-17-like n=1 Tax=Colias crocea TaxID=72248 RepID=UPI001E2800F3|nr:larval cuticle protein LCP-17-like [Colias croceus]